MEEERWRKGLGWEEGGEIVARMWNKFFLNAWYNFLKTRKCLFLGKYDIEGLKCSMDNYFKCLFNMFKNLSTHMTEIEREYFYSAWNVCHKLSE